MIGVTNTFKVTNSENYTVSDWESDMKLARDAHIDAFALNMAWKDGTNDASVKMAFTAANAVGFQLFFSFDYAGNGPWDKDVVIDMIQQYGSTSVYFHHNGKPFVSTFEGPGSADDWVTIKAQTGCFFMPDWSSVGAKPAVALGNEVADGLFSWSAWPWGNQTMDTYSDASYIQYLDGKPYMMAISPWFYTNLPGYNKNWIWKGDSLWFDRWQQLLALDPMPEFVQIISWNDYGESHYIGPIYGKSMAAFEIGESLYNYAMDYPHDAWRDVLPFMIDVYKNGKATMTDDIVVFWYRPNPVSACSSAGTTVNTASQLQIEFEPANALEDRIHVMALFQDGNSAVFVNNEYVEWDSRPQTDVEGDGELGASLWFGSVAANPGTVQVNLIREDMTVATAPGLEISSRCEGNFNNFNAWVGSVSGGSTGATYHTTVDLADQVCVKGKGAYDFNDLCNFTCSYGYCPVGACTCEQMGVARKKPKATGTIGYPAEGRDANYAGLCSFSCNYGHCPSKLCHTTEHPMPIPTVSDFLPPACVAGTGQGGSSGLCSYACDYGYCPINLCTCTKTGALVQPPAQTGTGGAAAPGQSEILNNLCDFTCSRGYCPPGTCASKEDAGTSNVKIPKLTWGTDPTGAQCEATQKQAIEKEFGYAIEMVQAAQKYLQTGKYYETFFAESVRARPNFADEAVKVYKRVEEMLDGTSTFKVQITCEFGHSFCERGDLAFMNALRHTMNICGNFFTSTKMAPTSERIAQIPPTIYEAHHSISTIFVHEMTHTKFALSPLSGKSSMNGRDFIARDFAYGWESCKALADGTFNRGCQDYANKPKTLCPNPAPDGLDGKCLAELSAENADNWAVIAAGIYFSQKSKKAIPIPSTRPSTADAGCTQYDDIMIDQNGGDGFEPTGMVSFGDSFAAGMGTGKTTGDTCRVGSNNYGTLLNKYLGEHIPIEKKMCSGDTTTGLERQIKEWKSASTVDFATLTMGGNDLGFSDIAWYCIVTPWPMRNIPAYRKLCVDSESKARSLLNDQGESGMRHKLRTLYKSILNKAEKTDFNLFVTGYVGFFNQDTTDCDQSSFYYLNAGYKPSGNAVKLTRDLRTELNLLVSQLNNVIEDAVKDANAEAKTTQIHYVDVQQKFDSHRWCEQGSWHEPDSSVPSTYFFLSSWPDLPLKNEVVESSNFADVAALVQTGSINLPSPSNCNTALGSDPDPYAKWMCMVSVEIDANPNGEWAQAYGRATQGVADGNVNIKEINWFTPTSQIKAFHPRSPGMALYRDAILEKIDVTFGSY